MERGLIAVDRWGAGSQAYFLTHLHYDHTAGLSSAWARGPLFCSRVTAKLFSFKFPEFRLSLLRVIDIGLWHSFSLVSPSSGSQTVVEVMAIDAHHCPGAVMYLFRGEFGYMLYTGDFRWEATDGRARLGRTTLLNALEGYSIDTIYMDNTYCNPTFSFPPRDIAAQQIVDIIVAHPEHDIVIAIHSLGKEELLLQIACLLKIKIWVWPERLQTLHILGFHDIFTTKTSLTRVRAVPRYSFSIETLEGLNAIRPTIGIMPSGLPWVVNPNQENGMLFGSFSTSHDIREEQCTTARTDNDENMLDENFRYAKRFHPYIYTVPYSDHSCFPELQEFVKLLQPKHIKGIVSSTFCYIEPLYHLGHHCGIKLPSQEFREKLRKVGCERVTADQTKANIVKKNLRKVAKHGVSKSINYLGVRLSRVSILRRRRLGSKISEFDF